MSDSVRSQRGQLTRLPRPWDSPGKNTGVGCHFLLQCMKVKSESEVAQSCPTLSDPMDYSLPGSSIHGIFQARVLECGAIAFSICGIIQCLFFVCLASFHLVLKNHPSWSMYQNFIPFSHSIPLYVYTTFYLSIYLLWIFRLISVFCLLWIM